MSFSALIFLLAVTAGFVLAFTTHPFYGLLAYIFIYFNIPDPRYHWWALDVPQIRWSLLGAIMLGLACIVRKERLASVGVFSSPSIKWLMAFFLYSIVISPFALSTHLHMEKLYDLLVYLVIVFFIVKCLTDFHKYEWFVSLYVICCTWLAWLARTQGHRFHGRLEGIGTPDSADANSLAALLLTAVPFFVIYVIHGKKYQRIISLLCMPVLINGIVLCSSRGAFLGLVAVILALIVLERNKVYRKRMVIGALLTAAMLIYLMDPVYKVRLRTLRDPSTEGSGLRVRYWKAGIRMALDHPLGAGGEGFHILSRQYLPSELLSRDLGVRSSHNTYILVLVENGFIGFVLYGMLIVSTLRLLHLARRKISEKDYTLSQQRQGMANQIYIHSVALEGSIVGFLVTSMFIDRIYYEPIYWIIATSLCIYSYATKLVEEKEYDYVGG